MHATGMFSRKEGIIINVHLGIIVETNEYILSLLAAYLKNGNEVNNHEKNIETANKNLNNLFLIILKESIKYAANIINIGIIGINWRDGAMEPVQSFQNKIKNKYGNEIISGIKNCFAFFEKASIIPQNEMTYKIQYVIRPKSLSKSIARNDVKKCDRFISNLFIC
jgi:hypothetical protein